MTKIIDFFHYLRMRSKQDSQIQRSFLLNYLYNRSIFTNLESQFIGVIDVALGFEVIDSMMRYQLIILINKLNDRLIDRATFRDQASFILQITPTLKGIKQ